MEKQGAPDGADWMNDDCGMAPGMFHSVSAGSVANPDGASAYGKAVEEPNKRQGC